MRRRGDVLALEIHSFVTDSFSGGLTSRRCSVTSVLWQIPTVLMDGDFSVVGPMVCRCAAVVVPRARQPIVAHYWVVPSTPRRFVSQSLLFFLHGISKTIQLCALFQTNFFLTNVFPTLFILCVVHSVSNNKLTTVLLR